MENLLFLLKSFHIHEYKTWFFNNGFTKEISNQKQRIQINSPQNVWIHSCYFQNIYEPYSAGGAISMRSSSNQTLLLVEHSTFYNCSCNGAGGSIYQTKGNFKLRFVCASIPEKAQIFSCFASDSTDTYDNFQEIEYCSTKCTTNPSNLDFDAPIQLYHGCISIQNLNISQVYNNNHFISLLYLGPTDYEYNSIQYSSFVNNSYQTSNGDEIVYMSRNQINFYMCNILKNKAYCFIYITDTTKIYHSCILDNEFNYFFCRSNPLQIYLYNCSLQELPPSTTTYACIYSHPSSSFLHGLDCFATAFCVAEYDYLDDLHPYLPTNQEDKTIETLSKAKSVHKRKVFM